MFGTSCSTRARVQCTYTEDTRCIYILNKSLSPPFRKLWSPVLRATAHCPVNPLTILAIYLYTHLYTRRRMSRPRQGRHRLRRRQNGQIRDKTDRGATTSDRRFTPWVGEWVQSFFRQPIRLARTQWEYVISETSLHRHSLAMGLSQTNSKQTRICQNTKRNHKTKQTVLCWLVY